MAFSKRTKARMRRFQGAMVVCPYLSTGVYVEKISWDVVEVGREDKTLIKARGRVKSFFYPILRMLSPYRCIIIYLGMFG